MTQLPDPEAVIRASGPWVHRDIAANGCRFHVVESGEGPAVLLLHGFPMFWWTWRHHIPLLADAGYRVIAMDLRGYAGSDHPPEGYDPRTMAADVAGVIRSLGETNAVVVGHGWGGMAAWSAAVLHPETVRAIAPVAMPHPRALRSALLRDRRQRAAMRYAWGFQIPFAPERRLAKHDGNRVAQLIRGWSQELAWASDELLAQFQCAFLRWPTAHTAIEYHRWAVRSALRPDGLGYMALMEAPLLQPVLHVHGTGDPMILPTSAEGTSEYVRGAYTRIDLDTGHFVHEERPDEFSDALITWLDEIHRRA